MFSLRWELSACSKWWTSPTSPNLDIHRSMDFELLDELVNGVGTLLQGGELLLCCCLSIRIHEHEVNLSLKLIRCHQHLRGAKDLLDFVHHPCPGSSALHEEQDEQHLPCPLGERD